MRIIIFTMIIVVLSGVYLVYAWNRHQDVAESEAIMLAQSLESVFHPEHITNLTGSSEDLGKSDYKMTKQSLIQLVETTNPIRFAYLMIERDGNIVFLMDSEPADSADYSPPGQIYEEVDDVLLNTFSSDKAVLTKPTADRWGTWISVLVPMKDPTNDKNIAVFGIDYSASEWYADIWKKMIPDVIVVLCSIVLVFAWFHSWTQKSSLKKLSKKIAFNEALYHSVFDHSPVGIAIMNDKNYATQSEFGVININPMFEHILGRKSGDLVNTTWPEVTHPEDLQADLEKFEQFKTGEISGYSMEKRFLRPDGSSVWTNMIVSHLQDLSDNNSSHICLIEDITSKKKMNDALIESERSKSVLISNLPGMAYRCNYDKNWTMQFVSDGCIKLTGYAPESLINNKDISFNALITPEYREPLWKEWERIIAKKLPFRYEYEITAANGDRKWVLELGEGVYDEKDHVEMLEGIILDISDRKEIEKKLIYTNEHDRWTGLHNRDYLESLLEKDGKQQVASKRALIVVNLTPLQSLTINYGFHYIQSLMKKVVETLDAYKTDNRMLFKTYENRFAFYLKNYKDKNELIDFSNIIASDLRELFISERVGGGIGIIEIDQDNELEVDLLLRRLLIASERSISEFDEEFIACFYDVDLEKSIKREGDIRRELARIASDDECDELFLLYQPILDLKTDSVCGFEALARLKTNILGLVSPLEFIPIAEKTKLIIPLGNKLIRSALRFICKLTELGHKTISVAINISAIQLFRPDFTVSLFDMISEMHVNPQNIGIEITESIFASDHDFINNVLGKLRDAGLHIAIDDFGTGYSSLSIVKDLNVNCLKIDKYFVDKLLEDEPDKAITGDIISMTHRLGHCAVAEGVEQEVQKQYLLSHGCDKIQGYLVSKPMDEEAAVEFLAKHESLNSSYHTEADGESLTGGDACER